MGSANMGARRHHRHVCGERQQEARRCGSGSGRGDEHDDRRLRGDHARHHRPRRIEQSTGRAQRENQYARVSRGRARDRVVKQLRRDGVDDAVVFDEERDGGCTGRRRRLTRLPGGTRRPAQRQAGSEHDRDQRDDEGPSRRLDERAKARAAHHTAILVQQEAAEVPLASRPGSGRGSRRRAPVRGSAPPGSASCWRASCRRMPTRPRRLG